jgi:alpha-1,2-mannosyltransferase
LLFPGSILATRRDRRFHSAVHFVKSTKRILFVVAAAATLAGGIYCAGQSGSDPNAYRNDFNVFYFASSELLEGRTPYERSLGEWTPYLYPPFLAELLCPVALLPLPAAAYVWYLINVAALITCAAMTGALLSDKACLKPATAAGFRQRPYAVALAAAGLAVVLRFALDNLAMGQVNIVTAALSTAHIYLYVKGRRGASAAALALAAAIKLTPAILVLFYLARGRVKLAAASAALSAGLVCASFVPLGADAPGAVEVFFERTIKNGQGYDLGFEGNQSLRGFEARLFRETGDDSRRPSTPVTLGLALAFLAFCVAAARRCQGEVCAAAPFFCLAVLISPLGWKSHFVILLLPAALVAREALARAGWSRLGFATALVLAFVLFNATSPRLIGVAGATWADRHSLVAAGAVSLFFAAAACGLLISWSRGPVSYGRQGKARREGGNQFGH